MGVLRQIQVWWEYRATFLSKIQLGMFLSYFKAVWNDIFKKSGCEGLVLWSVVQFIYFSLVVKVYGFGFQVDILFFFKLCWGDILYKVEEDQ